MASNNVTLCPVCLTASIVRRIWATNNDTDISTVMINDGWTQVTSANVINALWDAVEAIGEDRLWIKKAEVGTHSIKSDAAMTIYLGECPIYMIMLIGRWFSNAFLRQKSDGIQSERCKENADFTELPTHTRNQQKDLIGSPSPMQ